MSNNPIQILLSDLELSPILFDIGSSAGPPKIWNEIASDSIYVGFDPDLREIREIEDGIFQKAIFVNKAVTADHGEVPVTFYFTKSPYCSSSLQPDGRALSDYLFADLFEVERTGMVDATTLNQVLSQFSLPFIDWFKTDSQGTDLRLFDSLDAKTKDHVLAVDIEPGLIDAYCDEDLFVEAHLALIRDGFWLSNLSVRGSVRMNTRTFTRLKDRGKVSSRDYLLNMLPVSPGWCEARYLRTQDYLAAMDMTQREYRLLWIFSVLDNQPGFALDLAAAYEDRFGSDPVSETMYRLPLDQINSRSNQLRNWGIKSKRLVKTMASKAKKIRY